MTSLFIGHILDKAVILTMIKLLCFSVMFLRATSATFSNFSSGWEGELLWKQNLGGEVISSPVVTTDSVIVGSNAKKVHSLDRLTGEISWTFNTIDEVRVGGVLCPPSSLSNNSSRSYDDNSLDYFVSTVDGNVYALKANNGSLLWIYDAESAVNSSPVCGDDEGGDSSASKMLHFGSTIGYVHSVDRSDGTLLWEYNVGSEVVISSQVKNRRVTVGAKNHIVYGLRTKNGKKKWEFDAGGEVTSPPLLDERGVVYVGSTSGFIHAIHQTNGSLIWSNDIGDSQRSLIYEDDTLFVATSNGNILAMKTTDGVVVWSHQVGHSIDSPLNIDENGLILYGGDGGSLYALDPSNNGTTAWSFSVKKKIKSQPLVSSDGVVYFGSRDKKMYALRYWKGDDTDDADGNDDNNDNGGNDGDDDSGGNPFPVSGLSGDESASSLNAGAISGIVIGCLMVTATIVMACVWFHCKRGKK